MNNRLLKEQIKAFTPQSERLLVLLDAVKDYIADARNGEWSVEARKSACDAIDEVLYKKVKLNIQEKPQSKGDNWI